MTGYDVFLACRGYERDMERLRMQAAMARDAVTRATRSAEVSGHGGGEDRIAAYAARADALSRAMDARRAMYDMEQDAAARLIARMETRQGQAIYLLMVRGMTVRQCAACMHTTEAAVRGLRRRAREALGALPAGMGERYDKATAHYAERLREARGGN